MYRFVIAGWLLFLLGVGRLLAEEALPGSPMASSLEIRSVSVGGKTIPRHAGMPLYLKPFPRRIFFGFGPATNSSRAPIRLRYKLEGYDQAWHEGGGDMYFGVRFLDKAGNLIAIKEFKAIGDSAGWNGSLENSALTHRRETIPVPPGASLLQTVISSAGPPSTVGLFVVDDLVVSKLSASNNPPEVLLRSPFGRQSKVESSGEIPQGWIRDGTRPGMAKILELGKDPSTKTFAILDEDGLTHAEWRTLNEIAPRVVPGEQLLVEWNEMFTMGVSDVNSAYYDSLPNGDFRFCVAEATALGNPTGAEASLLIHVALPFWRMAWFWAVAASGISFISVAIGRYFSWYRMRREMARLKQQRLLEQERLRIARNIHDDLGARVTQISLLSGMAQDNPNFPPKARDDFESISRMSRDLVSALYETVWTVNPENDNLDALGNYLCQMADQLCNQARLRCRINVLDLPRDIQLSSQIRHQITMAVKEAIHNVIKHANASEVNLRVEFDGRFLSIALQDNGCGFNPNDPLAGNGLTNMKRRLSDMGGECTFESKAGEGAIVRIRLEIGLPAKKIE